MVEDDLVGTWRNGLPSFLSAEGLLGKTKREVRCGGTEDAIPVLGEVSGVRSPTGTNRLSTWARVWLRSGNLSSPPPFVPRVQDKG